jgi:hypothetical protein
MMLLLLLVLLVLLLLLLLVLVLRAKRRLGSVVELRDPRPAALAKPGVKGLRV